MIRVALIVKKLMMRMLQKKVACARASAMESCQKLRLAIAY